MKRSIDLVDDICAEMRPTKRLSMLHNTPKQWKEQRKSILKMSKSKLKAMGDVESNLRKSVLINNTYKKMRRELKEQCPYNSSPSHFAPYTPEPCSNKRKSNNGYISMAKEDLEESEIVSREGVMSMEIEPKLCQYSALENNSDVLNNSTNTNVDTEPLSKTQCDQIMQSVTEDTICDEQKHSNDDLTVTTDDHSAALSSCTAKSTLMDTTTSDNIPLRPLGHGYTESIGDGANTDSYHEEVIDLTLKAKDLPNYTTDQCPVHSPFAKNSSMDINDNKLGHTDTNTCSKEPCCSSAMDLHINSDKPYEEGQEMTIANSDANKCIDQSLEKINDACSSSQLSSSKVDHEQENKSVTSSQECEDFSLCKFASRPLNNLPNIFTPDVIPSFSTSSLVSILAAREYHSSTHTYSSALFSCTTTYTESANPISSQTNECAMDCSKKPESSPSIQTQETTPVTSMTNDNVDSTHNNTIPHLLGLDEYHDIDQNTVVENNRTIEASSDGLCSSLVSSCDIDVHQHNWACFQHFSMAVACS